MEMMNRAIEDVADFREMIGKLRGGAQADPQAGAIEVGRYIAVPDRLHGENRAEYRARLKRERREAKGSRMPA